MAALIEGADRAEVLTGLDDDNVNNPIIQPAGVAANHSLNNTDIILGETRTTCSSVFSVAT